MPANRLSGTRGALWRCPKAKWIGTVESTDEGEAIEKAVGEFQNGRG
jgi:hypothetical protein